MAKPAEINECAFEVSQKEFENGKWAINHKQLSWDVAKDMKNFYPGEYIRKQCGDDWVSFNFLIPTFQYLLIIITSKFFSIIEIKIFFKDRRTDEAYMCVNKRGSEGQIGWVKCKTRKCTRFSRDHLDSISFQNCNN